MSNINPNLISVRVETLGNLNTRDPFQVDLTEKVVFLAEAIFKRTGVPINDMNLLYKNRPMDLFKPIGDYLEGQQAATVHLVVRFGGAPGFSKSVYDRVISEDLVSRETVDKYKRGEHFEGRNSCYIHLKNVEQKLIEAALAESSDGLDTSDSD